VYDAVIAAGLSFPFPQREIRVLSNGVGEAAIAAQSSQGEKPGR
jgi:hypothetical protein